jgi:hypothetical protein
MHKAVRLWLLSKARAELTEVLAALRETQRLKELYHRRNAGEDGHTPGIWYQEQECEQAEKRQQANVATMRQVVAELS